jgi:high affinity sulfate transporter 1
VNFRIITQEVFLSRHIPIAGWLPTYPRSFLRFDIVAGLTTAAVIMPKAMAMAAVAGLPVELGLYTALLPMAIYAIFGTSRRLSMSTTATIGMLTGAALTEMAHESATEQMAATAVTLSLMTGVALLLASFLKLGNIANFISDPVLTGFKVGLGLVIVADQLPKVLGVHIEKVSFGRDLLSLWRHLPETSGVTLALSASTLLLIFALEHFAPHSPAPLFAVVAGIAACWSFDLQRSGVAVVGHTPAGLPGFQLPGLALIHELWPAAIGIALMSFTETIAVGRAFAAPSEPRPDADQELRAIGLANLVGSMFHAMPAGGGTSQTAVNCRAGARTQISELVTAGMTAIAVLFLAPLISLMPQATLAAVVITTSVGLINPKELLHIRQLRHMEFWWGVSAASGVVVLGTLKGILAAVIISLAALTYESNRVPVYALGRKPGTNVFRPTTEEHPEDETFPRLLMVRTEGRMYFANAQRVGDRIWSLVHEAKPQVLVLDCSAIPDFEYTALRMLIEGERKLREAGAELWLAGLNPAALDLVRRSSLGPLLGRERMCFDLAQAVSRFQELKTPVRC